MSETTKTPPTPLQTALRLISSKKLVKIPDTETAENEFTELLKLIPDADLRERIDTAAGKIAYAYEKLGFVEGFILSTIS